MIILIQYKEILPFKFVKLHWIFYGIKQKVFFFQVFLYKYIDKFQNMKIDISTLWYLKVFLILNLGFQPKT